MGYVVIGFLGISVLILAHEMGHFLIAKLFKMPVDVFCIGYGKPLKFLRFKYHNTTYGLGYIPFGGYVKIPGLDPREAELLSDEKKKDFKIHKYWKRILVAIGGSLANIIMAAILFSFIFMIGVPEPTNTIEKVIPDSPAKEAGLRSGDEIVSVDGKNVSSWEDTVKAIRNGEKDSIDVEVKRDGQTRKLVTEVRVENNVRFIGIVPESDIVRANPLIALYKGAVGAIITTVAVVQGIYLLLIGEVPFRPVSPIGIVQITSMAARHGLVAFIDFIAFISILLGITNLLPLYPLDGGRVLLWTFEKIKGSPFKLRTVLVIQAMGVGLLFVLMVSAVYLDILRPLPDPFR